jgi:hypothetical protein
MNDDILVVTAGDANFRPYVANAERTTRLLGYPVLVFDLGGLDLGEPFEGRVSSVPLHTIPCKPHMLREACSRVPENSYVVWLDGDAIMQARIDEIRQDYDIGVTMRSKFSKDPRVGAINAGIVFVRNTASARRFLEVWAYRADEFDGDQSALNDLVPLTKTDRDQLVHRQGARIQVFPCSVYNFFDFKNDASQAKIVHYKSKHRAKYPLET